MIGDKKKSLLTSSFSYLSNYNFIVKFSKNEPIPRDLCKLEVISSARRSWEIDSFNELSNLFDNPFAIGSINKYAEINKI